MCSIHCFITVVCGVVGMSVVRESTQGSQRTFNVWICIAAGAKDDEQVSVPQLTQEGKLRSALILLLLLCNHTQSTYACCNVLEHFSQLYLFVYIVKHHMQLSMCTVQCMKLVWEIHNAQNVVHVLIICSLLLTALQTRRFCDISGLIAHLFGHIRHFLFDRQAETIQGTRKGWFCNGGSSAENGQVQGSRRAGQTRRIQQ